VLTALLNGVDSVIVTADSAIMHPTQKIIALKGMMHFILSFVIPKRNLTREALCLHRSRTTTPNL
jgi:hypothetical protein